jgi:hypothetical protein
MCRRQIPALDPKSVILVPETFRDRLDFALDFDASAESGAASERPLNQVSQIAVVVHCTDTNVLPRWDK